jgi:hypothetical protein
VLRPHLEGGGRLHVAGHSLGGSLATLVAIAAHLRLGGGGGSREEDVAAATAAAAGQRIKSSVTGSGGSGKVGGGTAGQRGRLAVQCTTFGSPPVLALARAPGEDGRSILAALRLPLGAVRNYVLQVAKLMRPAGQCPADREKRRLPRMQAAVHAGLHRLALCAHRFQAAGRRALHQLAPKCSRRHRSAAMTMTHRWWRGAALPRRRTTPSRAPC